jgi:hypothetical protein
VSITSRSKAVVLIVAAVAVVGMLILFSILPHIDARSTSEQREGPAGISVQFETFTAAQDSMRCVVLGTSDITPTITDELSSMAVNVTTIIDVLQVPSLGSKDVLFIDGQWLVSQPHEVKNNISAVVAQGVPTFVVNGSMDVLDELASANLTVRSIVTSSNDETPVVRGVKVSTIGGPTLLVEIGGRAANEGELRKAVNSTMNWVTNIDGMFYLSVNPFDYPIYWNLTLVHYYYSGDLFKPYGRVAFENFYYDWIAETGWDGIAPAELRLVHYRVQVDPGWAVYDSDYRTSRVELVSISGRSQLWDYAASSSTGESLVHMTTYNAFGKEYLSPTYWKYTTNQREAYSTSDSSIGKAGWVFEFDPGDYYSGRHQCIEPGLELCLMNGAVDLSGYCSVAWSRADSFSWVDHQVRIDISGKVG